MARIALGGGFVPADGAAGAYRRLFRRRLAVLIGLGSVLMAGLLLDLTTGPAGLGLAEVIAILLHPGSAEPALRVVVFEIRLPVALMAAVVGAMLAVAGAEMQTILNNPLASPFTLGISAAASFGAALAIVLGVGVLPLAGPLLVTGNAFVFAIAAAFTVFLLARLRGATTETVVLLGIALVFAFNAALALLQFLATERALQEVVFWTLGSLGKANWQRLAMATAVLLLVLPLFMSDMWGLTALRLGDAKARSLGVPVERLRLQALVLVSLLAAVAVAFVGTIGFIGLVGPHVARILTGEDQRFFLPAAALSGAALLSLTSVVSKAIVPGVIFPVGIITALVGVPVFLTLILARRRQFFA